MVLQKVAIKLPADDYNGWINLGLTLVLGLTGNPNFATPVPSASALETAVTLASTALSNWGHAGNRGSKLDLANLKAAIAELTSLIRLEAQYVQTTAQTACGTDYVAMKAYILSSGFQVANAKSPQGVLESVQNLRKLARANVGCNQAKLQWKKPANLTSKTNLKSYLVFRGTAADFTLATQIAMVSKTSYTDTNYTAAPLVYYYWIVPVSTAGNGVTSVGLKVTLASAS